MTGRNGRFFLLTFIKKPLKALRFQGLYFWVLHNHVLRFRGEPASDGADAPADRVFQQLVEFGIAPHRQGMPGGEAHHAAGALSGTPRI